MVKKLTRSFSFFSLSLSSPSLRYVGTESGGMDQAASVMVRERSFFFWNSRFFFFSFLLSSSLSLSQTLTLFLSLFLSFFLLHLPPHRNNSSGPIRQSEARPLRPGPRRGRRPPLGGRLRHRQLAGGLEEGRDGRRALQPPRRRVPARRRGAGGLPGPGTCQSDREDDAEAGGAAGGGEVRWAEKGP